MNIVASVIRSERYSALSTIVIEESFSLLFDGFMFFDTCTEREIEMKKIGANAFGMRK